ncbi:EAL domain-containing protein [Pseudomonas protegens]|uniref:EAL domain-containing protein n=1 Tax=Pseudomonas protegens TaxID=380021 RepID=UPI003804B3D0
MYPIEAPVEKNYYLVVEMRNYHEVEVAYGIETAEATMKKLQSKAHFLGGSITVISEAAFLIELPSLINLLNVKAVNKFIEGWQIEISTTFILNEGSVTLSSLKFDYVVMEYATSFNKTHRFYSSGGTSELKRLGYGFKEIVHYQNDMENSVNLTELLMCKRLKLDFQPVNDFQEKSKVLYYSARIICAKEFDRDVGKINESIRSLENIGLVRLFDQAVVMALIRKLKENSRLQLGCRISSQSLTLDGWWFSVVDELTVYPEVAKRLNFEVAQTFPIINFHEAYLFLKTIKALGCHIVLDNFGGGSNEIDLAMMTQPHAIKIQMSFMDGDTKKVLPLCVLKDIVKLCKNFSVNIIVECIDDLRMKELLKQAGCLFVQHKGEDQSTNLVSQCWLTIPKYGLAVSD